MIFQIRPYPAEVTEARKFSIVLLYPFLKNFLTNSNNGI